MRSQGILQRQSLLVNILDVINIFIYFKVINQRMESAGNNVLNSEPNLYNIDKLTKNKIENTEHSNYLGRFNNRNISSKSKFEESILTEIQNSFVDKYERGKTNQISASNSANKRENLNSEVDYITNRLSTDPSSEKLDKIDLLKINKFDSSISINKDEKIKNEIQQRFSSNIKTASNNTPIATNKFIESKSFEKFPIKLKSNVV